MKKLMTIYKVVCAGLLAGVFTVACTEDDWGKRGGTQGGVALSSYTIVSYKIIICKYFYAAL